MKIFIFSPTNNLSGGTELLFQLYHSLKLLHSDTYITFFQENRQEIVLDRFSSYSPMIRDFEDHQDNISIIPESFTILVNKIKYSKKVVFWMSIDNYYRRKRNNPIVDFIKFYASLFTSRLPLFQLKGCYHLFQSHYAQIYLKSLGINGMFIGDYISNSFTQTCSPDLSLKLDQVCFNPKKGLKYITALKKLMPLTDFVPIINMTPEQVHSTLMSSKIYLDFGHHPGKDRIPREAALSNCIVITSRFGSANNDYDIPIPPLFKFLPYSDLQKCGELINFCFSNYAFMLSSQNTYRDSILSEKSSFVFNVKSLFDLFSGYEI